MRTGSPFETLHISLARAVEKDLSEIEYNRKDWMESKKRGVDIFQKEKRRPTLYDVDVDMFSQTWSDTSLGFGGMAGQAFTQAYTVVVSCFETGEYAVYHGGQLAYIISRSYSPKGMQAFREDLAARELVGAMDKGKYK